MTVPSKQVKVMLSEEDRKRVGEARAVLQEYGLYVDVADMSDVAYEKRVCRMKAIDQAVAAAATGKVQFTNLVLLAECLYTYIWEGHDAAVQD